MEKQVEKAIPCIYHGEVQLKKDIIVEGDRTYYAYDDIRGNITAFLPDENQHGIYAVWFNTIPRPHNFIRFDDFGTFFEYCNVLNIIGAVLSDTYDKLQNEYLLTKWNTESLYDAWELQKKQQTEYINNSKIGWLNYIKEHHEQLLKHWGQQAYDTMYNSLSEEQKLILDGKQ